MIFTRKWALTALITLFFAPLTWAANTTHDVVIVGAGSAGLYAAKNLIADGYDVLIIEASDRIGGRVKSATLGGTRIEMGAEEHYLATGSNPVWPALRGHYGTGIYVDAYQGPEVYSMDGGTNTCWYLASADIDCTTDPDVVLVDEIYNWYWRPNKHKDANSTLADDVLDEYGVGAGHRAYHIYDQSFAGGSYATNLYKLGARSLALQDFNWDLSEDIQVIGDPLLGYSDALETVWWDDVELNSDVLLSSPVTHIDTSGSDVIVTDANGDLHAARQVIVTVSIGVLQNEVIDFVPNLPASTVDAYNGIGIDMGMKVAMRFSTPWWQVYSVPFSWMVTEGLAGACWAPSDYKVGSTDHILMCYPMGDNGQILTDIGTGGGDQSIIDAILFDLDSTFPDENNPATLGFVEGIVQNWGADPYTMGVYSYPKVGTFLSRNGNNLRADLQVPVANNRIYFAGEGSHVTHPATVVGALHEGERAANNVHSVNGNPNNPPPLPGGGNNAPTAAITVPVSCTDLDCNFDGSGSSDSDGTIVSYDWNFGDGNNGSGVSPNHSYAAGGTYNVTLTVTDDDSATDNDNASVTVTAGGGNNAPTAVITVPVSCTDLDCSFSGSGSSDSDGTIVSYDWNFGDGNNGSGVSPNHSYAASGTYNVTLTVTDDDAATDNDNASVTVSAGGTATTLSVAAIVPDFIGEGGGQKRPTATVTIVDNLGNPAGSATVTGEFTGNASDPEASGVTNSSGNAVVSSENTKKGRLDFVFCVTDVTHASLNYASGDNVVTCATY